jgi:alpha-mannosidase
MVSRLKELIYTSHTPLEVEYAGPVGRISYAEAQKLEYKPIEIGTELGPLWSTYWFRLRGYVPEAWRGQRVDLIWISHSEATLYRDGLPVQGLNFEPAIPYNASVRPDAKLWESVKGGEEIKLDVEVACNLVFCFGMRDLYPYKTRLPYVFEQADIALFNKNAWDLYLDYVVLADVLKYGATDALTTGTLSFVPLYKAALDPWTGRILAVLNDVLNQLRPEDPETWPRARALMKELYQNHNATYQHEISAVGHAHIDTAWLWPLAETRRKCIRTFANALAYMDDYPEYKFCCSQAQQYAWVKEDAPALYERIKEATKRGQWIPTGGCWIEPDCNIPSGESLVRQFLYGKRFFREEFGVDCKEFWNPDVFGYSGALPQIMRECGFEFFLTQKLCFNEINKPMHHSFYWEGIDGSRVLTHFPPADSYSSMAVGFALKDILYSQKNHKDYDRSNQSMLLFGHGDGGGGPTKQMIEVLRRIKDLQGVPRTEQRSPLQFFRRLEENITDVPVYQGELYFEWHRGTYTNEANDKRDNRLSEFMLRDAELLGVVAATSGKVKYPAAELGDTWRLLCLQQFHDIIPGSSIREVYEDSARDYAKILSTGAKLKQQALAGIASGDGVSVLNTYAWDRRELVESDAIGTKTPQASYSGKALQIVSAPSCGIGPLGAAAVVEVPVQVKSEGGNFILENRHLRAEFKKSGQLTRLLHKANGDELIDSEAPGNQFLLFDDNPINCDAWNVDVYHLETRATIPDATSAKVIEEGPLRAALEFNFAFDKSKLKERVFLGAESKHLEFACEVNWHQRHQLLKVEFPVTVKSQEASYEIQFGHLKRSTNYNTSYDIARFETCGHRWVDLSEPNRGIALFTDSKYGYSAHNGVMRISLLRGSTDPDPESDQGEHAFRFACYPHAGSLIDSEVVRRAVEFNQPLTIVKGAAEQKSWWKVNTPNLMLDTVKKAEDSDATVVRLYECHGIRGTASVETSLPFRKAWVANMLEEKGAPVKITDGRVTLDYKPFQVITLIFET